MQSIKGSILVLILANVLAAQRTIDYSRKFDEFYGPNWEDAMSRLNNLALDLRNNPNAIGVLIVYGGQRGPRDEQRIWSRCVRRYLVNRRGINAQRIVMTNGGYREKLTVELWETVDKRHIPKPEPNVKPKDVRFTNRKLRSLCNL